ncbi:hypothetical protein [Kineosporia babensis]|uniref:Uncharacterized protein n=1 Tax=Kineosporia babensis TaxID=499548 RepID=A0A9X1SRV8_9ACTN|nr:hypothetical protein [Kineosporia babensis]MCD5309999.1 hypothetical protein [Kineosporia babensis]
MAERVEVDLTSLSTFAESVGGLADEHQETPATQAANLGTRNTVMAGSTVGFSEASSFTAQHAKVAASAATFLQEMVAGLATLSQGASVVAYNYASTDEKNAIAQRQLEVLDSEGRPSYEALAVPVHGKAEIPASGVNKVFAPPAETEEAAPKSSGDSMTEASEQNEQRRPPTAEERLIEKDRQMSGGYTTWHSQIGSENMTMVGGRDSTGKEIDVTISGDDKRGLYKFEAPYTHVEGS